MLKIHPYYFAGMERQPRHINAEIRFSPKFAENLIEFVECYSGIGSGMIASRSRKKEVIPARHAVVYILRKYSPMSLWEIGRLANIDHSTVSSTVRIVQDKLQFDRKFRTWYGKLIKELNDSDFSHNVKLCFNESE